MILPPLPGPTHGLAIGVMGGSFDPAHSGHAHVIETARKALGLDWVWVIPARSNPLKRTQTPFAERLSGAGKILAAPRTRISTLEHDADLTYTIDLIRYLRRRAPGARFVWIMGGDNLAQFNRWKAWDHIACEIPIAVVSRPGAFPKAGLSAFARRFADARLPATAARSLPGRTAPAWVYLAASFDPQSSTALRGKRQPA